MRGMRRSIIALVQLIIIKNNKKNNHSSNIYIGEGGDKKPFDCNNKDNQSHRVAMIKYYIFK